MPAIHQLVAGFAPGDAISNDALALRALFRRWGCAAEIFCEPRRTAPALRREARPAAEAAAALAPGDVALLHLSIGSPVNERFAALRCRKAIRYHNITPAHFLRGFQESLARDLAWGREQARALAGAAEVTMADSRYNAAELEALGYAGVRVVPIVLDFAAPRAAPDRRLLRTLGDGLTNVLFVGRGVPNKRIEDCLRAFAWFQRTVEPRARFVHVGSFAGLERYRAILAATVRSLGIEHALFAGAVPPAALRACYRAAHVFLCLSEHEGFCIPLLESMDAGVPVLAYAAAAVPEILDGAGVLARRKDWAALAEMIGRLAAPGPLRAAVLRGQQQRLERYRARDPEGALRAALAPLLGGAAG